MKDDWDRLAETVSEITDTLRKHDVSFWPDELDQINDRIKHKWREGPILLLELYGGMGSLNDVFICPENNHKIQERDVRPANQSLQRLATEAWTLAKRLEKQA